MPNAPQTRRKDSAGTSKTENTQQIIDLFGFTGLHQLGPTADGLLAGPGQKGRRFAYPMTAMLATITAARVAGSQPEALKLMRRPDTWEQCRTNYEKRSGGVLLPAIPPNRDQVRYARKLLESNPELLEALQLKFQRLAIGQARLLGNLLPGVTPEGTDPDERHCIYSDGTVIAPYSDVRVIKHPRTGEDVLIGSRAQCVASARIQRVLTDTSQDGKTVRGVNMVGVYTWTQAGRVVLATGKALGAEQWTVLDLIDSIHDILANIDAADAAQRSSIHTLINDRAITGWAVDYLMGTRGIQVLSKAVGAGSSTSASDEDINDTDLKSRVSRRAAEYGVGASRAATHILRHDVIGEMVRYHDHLPVGLSIYPTKKRKFDLVHSFAIELDPATHETSNGVCEHPLVVDDGALFLVADHPEENYQVKTRLLPCQGSARYRRPDGRWGTRNIYMVPCPHGEFEYERSWEPAGTRFTSESPKSGRNPEDRVGWRLRPLNRADDLVEWFNEGVDMHKIARRRFTERFSRRNDAESYNQWYQRSLPHHGRAASQSIAGQELDFLLGGLLNNSITWHNYKR